MQELTEQDRLTRLFVEAAYSTLVSINTREESLSSFALHHCVLLVKTEIDQFCQGLQTLGVF